MLEENIYFFNFFLFLYNTVLFQFTEELDSSNFLFNENWITAFAIPVLLACNSGDVSFSFLIVSHECKNYINHYNYILFRDSFTKYLYYIQKNLKYALYIWMAGSQAVNEDELLLYI